MPCRKQRGLGLPRQRRPMELHKAVNRIVTISFTPLDAPGGVPKFNRDLHAAFPDRERVHYSWWDFPWHMEVDDNGIPEWEKARTLNHYLISSRKILPTDVVVGDGFWVDGLDHMRNAVSHSHGIWSHLTKEDVDAGKKPENPFHHVAQVNFRNRWTGSKKHITAVSDFIAYQMRVQWGFVVDYVIENGVDTELYVPTTSRFPRKKSIIVHGVNDRGNVNKGWDHIQVLIDRAHTDAEFNVEILSLDEMTERYGGPKEWALSQADIFVHPSGYEGNSMMVAEALACGLPTVGYNVGQLYVYESTGKDVFGRVLDRRNRSPETTLHACKDLIKLPEAIRREMGVQARCVAPTKESFVLNWRSYVEEIENGRG
jgi:hypothetical protein